MFCVSFVITYNIIIIFLSLELISKLPVKLPSDGKYIQGCNNAKCNNSEACTMYNI